MMRDDLEARISRRLNELAPEPSLDFGERLASGIAAAPQRARPRLIPVGGVAGNRRAALLLAAALLVGLIAGAVAVGSGLVKLPSLLPSPAPTAPQVVSSEDPLPSQSPSSTQPLVAFTVASRVPDDQCPQFFHCIQTRVWVSNTDGSEARDLLPDWPGSQTAIAWSEDGSSLFFTHDSEDGGSIADALYVTDGSGRRPTLVMTGEQCTGSVCDNTAISPVGREIAFARGGETESVIAIFDTESGEARELEATRAGPYVVSQPRWSPDGRTLAYVKEDVSCYRPGAGSLVTVPADGGEVQEIAPIDTCAWDPRWSPDGRSIVFSSEADFITDEVDGRYLHERHDVFAVQPDGLGLRRLTDDQISSQASWTSDGRIVFARIPLDDGNGPLGFELWVMDANGANRSQLDASDLSGLSAVGCVACLYPPPDDQAVFGASPAVWQPT